jgi:hypothetical protein
MPKLKIDAASGSVPGRAAYGRALMTQKGGWSMKEVKRGEASGETKHTQPSERRSSKKDA